MDGKEREAFFSIFDKNCGSYSESFALRVGTTILFWIHEMNPK